MPIRWKGSSPAPLYRMVVIVSENGLYSWKLMKVVFALLFGKDVPMRKL